MPGAVNPERRSLSEKVSRLTEGDFLRLARFIYDECGIRMPLSKKTMLEARLQKRLRILGIDSFGLYCAYLFSSEGFEQEAVPMLDLVTTNKTDFFREADHFDYLVTSVLPGYVQKTEGAFRNLRIWSAGCSTGEEPYTLAMLLQEFAEQCPGFDFRILATDLSTRVLHLGRLAVYHEERTASVPAGLKRKYFLRSRDRSERVVRIVPILREKVEFRRLNFMGEDFGIRERVDIIFCRNVIIYFDRSTQERLLQRFCSHLSPGGFIFMGHSETLNGLDVPLVQVSPTIYRKVS